MQSAYDQTKGCTFVFLLFWLGGWSAATLLFDGIAIWAIGKQLHSLAYLEVPGVVTKSEMLVTHDSEDGNSYSWDIEYSYEVDGIGYTNDRRQYGFASGDRADIERLVKEHPVNSSIDVYYNPADPADSLLVRGVSAMDFFLPMFLIPFNVVMIGMFNFTVGARVRSWFCKRPATIKVRQRDVIWFAKVYGYLPIVVAGTTALVTSFILIFVVGFGQFLIPGWILMIPAWCIIIFSTLFAWGQARPTARLELDEYHQRLTVRRPDQVEPEVIDVTKIDSIEVRQKAVLLETGSTSHKLSCGHDRDAQWLKNWLRERCGRQSP